MLPVILSGGSGSRLWPMSRRLYPKQFLPLLSSNSLLQDTIKRLAGFADIQPPLIICNEAHRFIVAEQLRLLGSGHSGILLESHARNTAPAIACAALYAMRNKKEDDPLLLVLAADHAIHDTSAFHSAIALAAESAQQGYLLVFGVAPEYPETGYGYIRLSTAHSDQQKLASVPVLEFVEKPDLINAEKYLASGNYLWNSGMFLFRASSVLAEMEKWVPGIVTACRQALDYSTSDLDFIRLHGDAFARNPDISFDNAVLEKTRLAHAVPLNAGWSDVGSWETLWQIADKDSVGNVKKGNVLAIDSSNCYLQGAGKRLLATLGVKDLIIVDSDDALLVTHRSNVQDVRRLTATLKQNDYTQAEHHRIVYRPWGSYDSIGEGERYQVKRITVMPGGKLSVQMHHHRAEHWIIVSGTARILNGDQEIILTENQSTYIPVGGIHSLENPGKIPLELIEVQSGAYLGEDDIVRIRDCYGRS